MPTEYILTVEEVDRLEKGDIDLDRGDVIARLISFFRVQLKAAHEQGITEARNRKIQALHWVED